jgi:hypothetical protein
MVNPMAILAAHDPQKTPKHVASVPIFSFPMTTNSILLGRFDSFLGHAEFTTDGGAYAKLDLCCGVIGLNRITRVFSTATTTQRMEEQVLEGLAIRDREIRLHTWGVKKYLIV